MAVFFAVGCLTVEPWGDSAFDQPDGGTERRGQRMRPVDDVPLEVPF